MTVYFINWFQLQYYNAYNCMCKKIAAPLFLKGKPQGMDLHA